MHIYKFTISIIICQLIKYTIQDLSDISASKRYIDCQPGCSNNLDKRCNKFEIHLRATMTKCNNVISPFASSKQGTEGLKTCTLKCFKKLHATLKLINQGETSTINQYIIIDHVIDSANGQRVSLLNPYVVVIRQKPLMQLYGLKYKNMVNAEAKEQIINKRDPSFIGCDDLSDNPTCGNIRYNGDVIPYSQGFCCSCDEKKNVRRQPRNSEIVRGKRNTTFNIQELIFNKVNENDERELKRDKKSVGIRDFNDYRSSRHSNLLDSIIHVSPKIINQPKTEPYGNSYDYYDGNFEPESKKINREQHNIQIRGGQNCDDNWTPRTRANPSTYHDSAHCLRFSKLWYAIYQLSEPVLDHSLHIKIFEKREKEDGSTMWVDLTGGKTINIGSLHNKYEDQTLIVTYDSLQQNGEPLPFALDPKTKKVLIPQNMPQADFNKHPEYEGGSSEYLVLDTRNIQTSGDQCDVAGVGYSAFYSQPQRCSVPKGTCLRNQPSQLWRHDKMACRKGMKGKYFLKNFARVPDDAVRKTKKGDSKYLALHYGTKVKSLIDVEIQADDNIVFRSAPLAKITEVYVDSSSTTATILTIKIHNNGLTSNVFHPRLTDCPLELPVDWGNLEGDPIVIPPQHHSSFTLRLLGILPVNNFYCSVEALNSRNEITAVRRIRIVKEDRCICSWHCLCACYRKTGLGCTTMSMDHYKAAGFIGSMPLTINMIQVSYFESALFGFFFFVLLLIIILLLMGLTKGLIGLGFFVPIGIWGLDMLIGIRQIENYYEEHLKDRPVICDEDGWPVHPDTHQRSVRIVEEKVEFCLNLIFFFTYPLMLLSLLCSKMCCPYYAYSGNEDKGVYFQSVNTVSYTKCPASGNHSSDSENEDPFEFEGYSFCTESN